MARIIVNTSGLLGLVAKPLESSASACEGYEPEAGGEDFILDYRGIVVDEDGFDG